MKKQSMLLSCWPDGYSRYYTIARSLKEIFGSEHINILDVGGNSEWMHKFLTEQSINYSLDIVDVRKSEVHNQDVRYMQGDFFKLDLKSYDVVTNTDVLEHIPKEQKIPFIEQCLLLTKKVAIFSAPFEDPSVTIAEKSINKLYKKISGKEQPWLKEHFRFGKPKVNDIEKLLNKKRLPFLCLASNGIDNWLISFFSNLVNQQVVRFDNMDKINRFYNANIHDVGDTNFVSYRRIYVVFKDKTLANNERVLKEIFKNSDGQKISYYSRIFEMVTTKILEINTLTENLEKANQQLDKRLDEANHEIIKRDKVINDLNLKLSRITSLKIYKAARKAKKVTKKLSRK